MKQNLAKIALIFVVFFIVGATWIQEPDGQIKVKKELIGKWRASGEIPPSGDNRGMSWYMEYTFNKNNRYTFVGYPPIARQGKYKITSENGDSLFVSLFEGSRESGTHEIKTILIFSKDRQSFTLDKKVFYKSKDQ